MCRRFGFLFGLTSERYEWRRETNAYIYNLLITGWARQMKRMDMAEKVMQELMNDRDVSPDDRTFFCSHHVQPHAEQSIRSGDFPLVLDVGFFRSFFVESVADVPRLLPARLDSLLGLLGRLSLPRSFECDFLWTNDDHSISRRAPPWSGVLEGFGFVL